MSEINVVIQQSTSKIDVVIQPLIARIPIEVSMTKPGPQGDIGLQGIQGDIGLTGEQGVQGIQGVDGIAGPQGIQGVESVVPGPQGIIGPQGEIGPQGDTGLVGDTGIQGIEGPQGIQGDIGLTGADSIVAGPIGETGATGLQGETGASGPIGVTGLTGDTGIQGEIGETGLTGLTGTDGYTPIKGIDYFDGIQGIQGETGSDATVTTANVKAALDITTLSGDNTGDQDLSGKQETLISGTNIKTINSTSILGAGDLAIAGGAGGVFTFCQVRNTDNTTDIDPSTAANIPFGGINDATDADYTLADTSITVNFDGTVNVQAHISQYSASVARTNVGIWITKNNTKVSGVGQSGYVRVLNQLTSSSHMTATFTVADGDIIRVQGVAVGAVGAVTQIAGESQVTVERRA